MKGYIVKLSVVVLFGLLSFSTVHAAPADRFKGGVNDGYANSISLDITLSEVALGTVILIL